MAAKANAKEASAKPNRNHAKNVTLLYPSLFLPLPHRLPANSLPSPASVIVLFEVKFSERKQKSKKKERKEDTALRCVAASASLKNKKTEEKGLQGGGGEVRDEGV